MAEKPEGKGQGELYQAEGQQPPDAMAALPADYGNSTVPADVPKLGPPLPGDLGRPMLAAGQAGASPMAAPSSASPAAADPAAQQLAQERESARTSKLFGDDGSSREAPRRPMPPASPGRRQRRPPRAGLAGKPGTSPSFRARRTIRP
jgi:type IV secretory pathway VirB10-like protein